MLPGNTIGLLDFGMVGRLDESVYRRRRIAAAALLVILVSVCMWLVKAVSATNDATGARPRFGEHPDQGGSCLAQLMFHASLHADLALHAVVMDAAPLIHHWRDRLGLAGLRPHQGLPEAEDPAVVSTIDVPALLDYAQAVHHATAEWVGAADLTMLDKIPPASDRLHASGGVSVEAVPWLHAMWADKPISWFVQWECSGHWLNHLGEMISVRNRMGLSPF